MIIELDDAQVRQLIKEIYENYPEASSPSLQCDKWDYEKCHYHFYDIEEEQGYWITEREIMKALPLLLKDLFNGKIFTSLSTNLLDAGDWDAEAIDILTQYAIFGEAKYG